MIQNIQKTYKLEWYSSAVDPEIVDLNTRSLTGEIIYQYLCGSANISRRNDGRLRDGELRRYEHTTSGGWWCAGIDPLNNYQEMEWGCFKPVSPRAVGGKLIKYEHPFKEATRAFFLRVPMHIWQKVAQKHGVCITDEDIEHTGGFWHWVWTKNIPIILVEGAKKAGALLTAGYAAVGLPGIYAGYRKDKIDQRQRFLIPEIKHFATPNRAMSICFDQDAKRTALENTRTATYWTGGLLNKARCHTKIINLPIGGVKGVDDFIVANGESAFDDLYTQAETLDLWQLRLHTLLTYRADQVINRRYFGDIKIPDSAKLIAIKGGKGTGKTELLVQQVKLAHARGQRVLVISHRIQLCEALCFRFDIDYISEIYKSETKGLLGYGVCIDSLHSKSQAKFNPDDWNNTLVIIDECDQVFWHLLNSKTEVKNHRVEILANLKQLVQNVLGSASGKIILSSADLGDTDIKYVQSLAGFKIDPYVIVNNYQMSSRKAIIYPGGRDPRHLIAQLKADIENGGVPLVCCTAQKAKSRYSSQAIEQLLKASFPEKSILRIDSQTVIDPEHPACGCIPYLNKILHNYDIVIISPSVETGVSIDIEGHFTGVWLMANGLQPENSIRQMLARLREPVPRHLWVAKYGLPDGRIGNGATSMGSLLMSENSCTRAHISLLSASDYQDTNFLDQVDWKFQSESLRTWAIKACVVNAAMLDYQSAVLEGLAGDGYEIIFADQITLANDLAKEIKEIQSQIYNRECQLVENTLLPDNFDLQKSKDNKNKTADERYQERKASLMLSYGLTATEINAEVVKKDDAGWYYQLRLHYYLTQGRQFLSKHDGRRAKALIDQGNGRIWQPDFNRGQMLGTVSLLEEIGILKILEPGKQFTRLDPELIEIAALANKYRYLIKNYLRINIPYNKSPVAIAQLFLRKLGCKLTRLKQKRIDGEPVWNYELEPTNDGREQIFQRWHSQDTEQQRLILSQHL